MCAVEKAGAKPQTGPLKAKKAEAKEGPDNARELLRKDFKAADKDGDGKVSKDELKSKAGQRFEKQVLDQNNDGEFSWKESLKSLNFAGRDLNGDGELTGIETKGLDATKYAAGEDGKLTAEDYVQGRKAESRERRDAFEAKAFKKLDQNQDGVLSGTELKGLKGKEGEDGRMDLAEYQAAKKEERIAARQARVDAKFAKLDKNQDGVLSGNEITDKIKGYDQPGTVPVGPPSPADGKITKEEFLAGWRASEKARHQDHLVNGK